VTLDDTKVVSVIIEGLRPSIPNDINDILVDNWAKITSVYRKSKEVLEAVIETHDSANSLTERHFTTAYLKLGWKDVKVTILDQ
jgi:hypothetical protein